MLITPAFAQASGGGDMFATFLPVILIGAVFYFLMFRPQLRRQKEHQRKLQSITRGDKIVTNGGIVGKVTKVSEGAELEVEIAPDIKVTVMRPMVADLLSKPTPASRAKAAQQQPAQSPVAGFLGRFLGPREQPEPPQAKKAAAKPKPRAKAKSAKAPAAKKTKG